MGIGELWRRWRAWSPESHATVYTLILLGFTMKMPGGRVLVLPAIFTLTLVLLYWLAKPKAKAKE